MGNSLLEVVTGNIYNIGMATNIQFNYRKGIYMDPIIELLKKNFELKEIDVKEFFSLKIGPMKFSLESYKGDLINVSYMKGKALFGLMKMTTIVVTSLKKDLPIISCDRIKVGKKMFALLKSTIHAGKLLLILALQRSRKNLRNIRNMN